MSAEDIFPGFEDDTSEVPGAMFEVPGPNSFPTGSRVETSTENYAAGAPPSDTNSWTVQEARRRRAEQFGEGIVDIE